jgi:hypothetical protein
MSTRTCAGKNSTSLLERKNEREKKGSERINPILVDGTVYISDIEKSRLGE